MTKISTLDLWKFVILTAIADIITTYIGIHIFSLSETNPIVFTETGIGFVLILFSLKGIAIGFSYALASYFPKYNQVIPLALASVWSIVAVWNISLMISQV